ncbi:MAG: hypothetical protein ABS56_17630 [Lautropia sp. SCN 69-89]|nr:MAG: hypothetical protein ABS56_17630 [Lautropia sp. SCN 69-89]
MLDLVLARCFFRLAFIASIEFCAYGADLTRRQIFFDDAIYQCKHFYLAHLLGSKRDLIANEYAELLWPIAHSVEHSSRKAQQRNGLVHRRERHSQELSDLQLSLH